MQISGQRMEIWLAPMMGYTNGYFRSMIQALNPQTHLMTEMVTLSNLEHNPHHQTLLLHPLEQNTSLQIATGSFEQTQKLLKVLDCMPFKHINLNAGCPSPKVGKAIMGASLMHHANLTKNILLQLKSIGKTISIKTRIGVDDNTDQDWELWLNEVLDSKVDKIFLHARYAYLNGINPAQNRSIPPLRYDRAIEIAQKYLKYEWYLNGGLKDTKSINEYGRNFKGVMLGRVSYQNPWIYYELSSNKKHNLITWLEYIEDEKLNTASITSLLALTKGLKNAKKIRQNITQNKNKKIDLTELKDLVMAKTSNFSN